MLTRHLSAGPRDKRSFLFKKLECIVTMIIGIVVVVVCGCVCVRVCMIRGTRHDIHTEVRRQPCGVDFHISGVEVWLPCCAANTSIH